MPEIKRNALAEILGDDGCQCLDRVLQAGAITAEVVEQCKACGLDVTKAEGENMELLKLAAALKREAFPGRV